jgi:crotonobetainyl-CoA:carnitine CoA-transferase CaiB-like acyl-CoA transferase
VISIRDDTDWCSTAKAFGDPELAGDSRFATAAARVVNRRELVTTLSQYTRGHAPCHVSELLQAAGVPAGQMNRPPDIAEDSQLAYRKVFSDMVHPLIDHPLPAETGPAPYRNIPPAPRRPAPLPGQDTRAICRTVLAMDAEETEQLIADGVLSATAD